MGSRYRYVADDALSFWDPSEHPACLCCGKAGPVLPLKLDVRLGPDETEYLEAVCEKCLEGGLDIEEDTSLLYRVEEYFRIRGTLNPEAAATEFVKRLARQPRPMLCMQGLEWPICCNDFCEFTGIPIDAVEFKKSALGVNFWSDCNVYPGYDGEGILDGGGPESWAEVCFFRCLTCRKTYYTFQPT